MLEISLEQASRFTSSLCSESKSLRFDEDLCSLSESITDFSTADLLELILLRAWKSLAVFLEAGFDVKVR